MVWSEGILASEFSPLPSSVTENLKTSLVLKHLLWNIWNDEHHLRGFVIHSVASFETVIWVYWSSIKHLLSTSWVPDSQSPETKSTFTSLNRPQAVPKVSVPVTDHMNNSLHSVVCRRKFCSLKTDCKVSTQWGWISPPPWWNRTSDQPATRSLVVPPGELFPVLG